MHACFRGFSYEPCVYANSMYILYRIYYSFDTIRRRMQVQNLHLPVEKRLNSFQSFYQMVTKEGLRSVYRGLTPELLKVVRSLF